MSLHLTRLAVENRELLAVIAAGDIPATLDGFARAQGRDPANFRRTLRALEGEGWIVVNQPGSARAADAAEAGRRALLAMDVAAGAAEAGLPPLTHAQIFPDPEQPRRDFDEVALAELAESIASRNLKQPILVRMTGEGSAMIVAGERRWRAIGRLIAAGDARWPADRLVPYALEEEKDAGEILATQVVENVQRQGLHPLEEGEAFKRLKDGHGWGVGKISQAIGRTRRFVEQRLDLLNLTPAMQARMRLPKDDEHHLTVPRAREILAHLRQVTAGVNEQRDVEELAPAGIPADQVEAAQKAKLNPRELLALAEIAAAIAAAPSPKFPNSPVPVVDVDGERAARSEPLGRLATAKLATFLLDRHQEPEAAGVRIEPLGHLRLRADKLHPADNPRALFHLRREAGLSGDQARELQRLGRWSTNFLNMAPSKVEPVQADAEQPVRDPELSALSLAEYFSKEVQDAALAEVRKQPGHDRDICAKLSGTTTIEGETWPAECTRLRTPWSGYPEAEIRLTESDRGRWGVSLRTAQGGPRYTGQSSPPFVYSNDPIFLARGDALAYAAELIVEQLGEWGKKRKLQAWLAEIQITPAEAAPAEAAVEPLTRPEIQVLRAVAHAQAANGGAPVTVGRYWLDRDAVGLWKRSPSPLIEFKAEPGEHWTVCLTPAGGLELAKAGPSDADAVESGEGYAQAWLNGLAEDDHPVADDQLAPQDGADEDVDDPRNAEILRQVREELARPAPDFGALLQLIGIKGKLAIAGDVAIQAEGQDTDIVIDPWRTLSQPIAQAQAELVVWALNFAAGHIEPPPAAGDDLVDRVLHTGKELCGVLAGKVPPGTPLWFDVGAAYEPFAQARNALDWNRQRTAREAKAEPLLAIDVGAVMHKGTDATAFRILERLEDRPRQYGQQLEPAFRVQTLRHGKGYGDPVVIGLGDLVGFVPAKAAA